MPSNICKCVPVPTVCYGSWFLWPGALALTYVNVVRRTVIYRAMKGMEWSLDVNSAYIHLYSIPFIFLLFFFFPCLKYLFYVGVLGMWIKSEIVLTEYVYLFMLIFFYPKQVMKPKTNDLLIMYMIVILKIDSSSPKFSTYTLISHLE